MTKKSRQDTAREMGIVFNMVPRTTNLNESIEATRKIFSRCWFDEARCESGIAALASYHREFDEKRQVFKNDPVHDWASNSADAFRQMAQAWDDRFALTKREPARPIVAKTDFSVFD